MAYAEAMNLIEYEQLQLGPEKTRGQAFSQSMIKAGNVMSDIRIKTVQKFSANGVRYIDLPESDSGWGDINSDPQFSSNMPEPWAAQVYRYYKAWTIEKAYILASPKGEKAVFDTRMQGDMLAWNYDFNFKYFNNRRNGAAGQEKQEKFSDGLRARLAGAGQTNNPYKIPTEMKIDMNGIDVSSGSTTLGANTNLLMKNIAIALYRVGSPEGDDCIIHVGIDLLTTLEMGIRALGAGAGWSITQDAYGRQLMKYRNATVRAAGPTAPTGGGTQLEVLTSTESADGLQWNANSVYASIFIERNDPESLYIQQFQEAVPSEPYNLESGIHRRVVFYNYWGIIQPSTRAVCQIHNIKAR